MLIMACGRPTDSKEQQQLEELKRQGAEFDAAFDKIEERFLADQAQVALWKELRVRHEHVSALATSNASVHLVAMVKHHDHQEEKARSLQRKRLTASAALRGNSLAMAKDLHR